MHQQESVSESCKKQDGFASTVASQHIFGELWGGIL